MNKKTYIKGAVGALYGGLTTAKGIIFDVIAETMREHGATSDEISDAERRFTDAVNLENVMDIIDIVEYSLNNRAAKWFDSLGI